MTILVSTENVRSISQGRISKANAYKLIDISLMFVDPTYGHQRDFVDSWVKAREKSFDPEYLGTLEVSLRKDGNYAILDGQKRRALAERAGVTHLWCKVHEGLALDQEALLFKKLNDAVPLTACQKFASQVATGCHPEIDIHRMLMKHKMIVSAKPIKGHHIIANAATIVRLYSSDDFGPDCLMRSLLILRASWPHVKLSGVAATAVSLLLAGGCDEAILRSTFLYKSGEAFHPDTVKLKIKREAGGVTIPSPQMPVLLALKWLVGYRKMTGGKSSKIVAGDITQFANGKNGAWLNYPAGSSTR